MDPARWIDTFTLPGKPGPLTALEPVGAYTGQTPWVSMEGVPLCRPIAEAVARDPSPLPEPDDREGYFGARHFDYWLSGLKDFALATAALGRLGQTLRDDDAVFELGCSTARVLRHFVYQTDGLTGIGADLNRRYAAWSQRYLRPAPAPHAGASARPRAPVVFPCTAFPHLPLEDNRFGLVTAFSVFTHIDHFELPWLLELRRIMRPGGAAYITLQTDHSWSNLRPGIPLYEALLAGRDNTVEMRVDERSFRDPMPAERLVLTVKDRHIYNCNAFHSHDYIRRVWGAYFDVLDIIREGSDWQDVVVLRKPAARW